MLGPATVDLKRVPVGIIGKAEASQEKTGEYHERYP